MQEGVLLSGGDLIAFFTYRHGEDTDVADGGICLVVLMMQTRAINACGDFAGKIVEGLFWRRLLRLRPDWRCTSPSIRTLRQDLFQAHHPLHQRYGHRVEMTTQRSGSCALTFIH